MLQEFPERRTLPAADGTPVRFETMRGGTYGQDDPNYPIGTASVSWLDFSQTVHIRVYSTDGYNVHGALLGRLRLDDQRLQGAGRTGLGDLLAELERRPASGSIAISRTRPSNGAGTRAAPAGTRAPTRRPDRPRSVAPDRPRPVILVERDEGEQASVTFTSRRPRSRLAITSIRIAIEVRPIRSTRA